MKKLTIIHVTQQHIDKAMKLRDSKNGNYLPSRQCAVTRALKDVFGPNCSSNSEMLGLPFGIVDTPPAASAFIDRFDTSRPVEPFSFTIAHE